MSSIDQIKTLLTANGESVNSFARKIGLPQSSVSQWLLGNRKPPMEFVEAIAKAYPEVSLEWLLRGEGEMYVSAKPQQPSSVGEEYYKQMVKEMEAMKDRLDNLEGKVS